MIANVGRRRAARRISFLHSRPTAWLHLNGSARNATSDRILQPALACRKRGSVRTSFVTDYPTRRRNHPPDTLAVLGLAAQVRPGRFHSLKHQGGLAVRILLAPAES